MSLSAFQPSSCTELIPSVATSTALIQIPQAAEKSQPQKPQKQFKLYSWSIFSPQSPIFYARDPVAADHAISQLTGSVLGFDLEWKPTFVKGAPRNPVALVQLADANTIALIQISAMRVFPQALRDLLQDPNVIKAGVSTQDDCRHLWADYQVNCRNVVDLSLLARTVDNAHWKGSYKSSIGLARLCEVYFDYTLNKGRVQRSNWTLKLSSEQIEYAANDCHAGFMICSELNRRLPGMNPTPLQVYYTFDFLYGYLYEPSLPNQQGRLWHPHNPNYDPGPPPEPKPPKDNQKNNTQLAILAQLPMAVIPAPRRGYGGTRTYTPQANQSRDERPGGPSRTPRRPCKPRWSPEQRKERRQEDSSQI